MKKILLVVFPLALAVSAQASTVYQEVFSGGTPLASDPLVNTAAIASYFLNQAGGNGYVTQSSNSDPQTGNLGPGVTAGPAGYASGFFLVEGTGITPTGTNNTLFASSNFAVTANTNYTVSFQMANVNNASPASLTLQLNGLSLLSAVTVMGYYGDGNAADGWQTVTATWNSGSSTSASLALIDANTATYGNDFAIDNIQVASAASVSSATPEPSTFVLLGGAAIALGLMRRKRSKSADR